MLGAAKPKRSFTGAQLKHPSCGGQDPSSAFCSGMLLTSKVGVIGVPGMVCLSVDPREEDCRMKLEIDCQNRKSANQL